MLLPTEIVDAFYAAYAARDAEAAAQLYRENGFHFEAAMAKRREGREAISTGLAGFFSMLPDVTWSERERIVSGSSVVVNYTMRGTMQKRGSDGAEPEARSVELPGVHVFEFDNGELVGTTDFWDLSLFKQQAF